MQQRPRIRLYVSRWCAQCERAAALLDRHGLAYETIDVGDPEGCCRLHQLTGGASVPQVVVDGRPAGGYDELAALIRAGLTGAEIDEPNDLSASVGHDDRVSDRDRSDLPVA